MYKHAKTENRNHYIAKAIGVKEFCYKEDVNYPKRPQMEDGTIFYIPDYFVVDDIFRDGRSILFGIFDGHGGKDVVQFATKIFGKV